VPAGAIAVDDGFGGRVGLFVVREDGKAEGR